MPRRFVLQALDPDQGHAVLETLLLVTDIERLRAILGETAKDDPDLTRTYCLDAADLAAIEQAFGAAIEAGGRDVCLDPWHSIRDVPYLVHTGYELPLLLEGRKALACFSDVYPPERFFGEEYFDRYVAQGVLVKEVVLEPSTELHGLKRDPVIEGLRTVYLARPGEEWRIAAAKLIWAAAGKAGWSEEFERLEGMLYGYNEWQIDWWIARFRERRDQMKREVAP